MGIAEWGKQARRYQRETQGRADMFPIDLIPSSQSSRRTSRSSLGTQWLWWVSGWFLSVGHPGATQILLSHGGKTGDPWSYNQAGTQ